METEGFDYHDDTKETLGRKCFGYILLFFTLIYACLAWGAIRLAPRNNPVGKQNK